MATLEELDEQGVLHAVPLRGVTPVVRYLWVYDHVKSWMNDVLPNEVSFYGNEVSRPLVQAYTLFKSFITGDDLHPEEDFWKMRPEEHDVFELKSPDLRFFGWFPKPKTFLIAEVDTFERVHTHNLHAGYRDEVIRKRDALALDEPKVVAGARSEDVF